MAVCGLLVVKADGFHAREFPEDEAALIRAGNRMQKVDATTDLEELVRLAPKVAGAQLEKFSEAAADEIVEMLIKYEDEGEVGQDWVNAALDVFPVETLASQVELRESKKKLEANVKPEIQRQGPEGDGEAAPAKKMRRKERQVMALDEETLGKH